MQYTNEQNRDILLVGTLGRGNWTISKFAANPAVFAPLPTVSPIATQGVKTGSSSGVIGFTVVGGSAPAADLVVKATSSNPDLVPNANITLGGAGADRMLQFSPAPGAAGTGSITVTASDGTSSSFQTFSVVVGATAPTLSFLPTVGQTIEENTTTRGIPFAIVHAANQDDVTVKGTSSNPTLIPNANIVINRTAGTVTITPARDRSGVATITLTAEEGDETATTEFVVTVVPLANRPPVIAQIHDQVRDVGVSAIKVPFTVNYQPGNIGLGYISDEPDSTLQVPLDDLIIEVQSSNPGLIPLRDANGKSTITIVPSESNPSSFTLNATPTPGKVGTSTIMVTAYNGEFSLNRTFRLQIRRREQPWCIRSTSVMVPPSAGDTARPAAASIPLSAENPPSGASRAIRKLARTGNLARRP
jgi:hypothetical protein